MLKHDILVATPRFMRRVKVSRGCWIWQGSYLFISIGGRCGHDMPVKKFAWLRFKGERVQKNRFVLSACGNKKCVNPEHLELGTHEDRIGISQRALPRGEASGKALLTEKQVLAIRADRRVSRAVAPEYGVSKSTIAAIRRRETWRHI